VRPVRRIKAMARNASLSSCHPQGAQTAKERAEAAQAGIAQAQIAGA